jgi:hypothetical protein
MFSNTARIRPAEAGPFIATIYVQLCSFPTALSVARDLAQPAGGTTSVGRSAGPPRQRRPGGTRKLKVKNPRPQARPSCGIAAVR